MENAPLCKFYWKRHRSLDSVNRAIDPVVVRRIPEHLQSAGRRRNMLSFCGAAAAQNTPVAIGIIKSIPDITAIVDTRFIR